MAEKCEYYQPCPTRVTVKETEEKAKGLEALSETFCDSNCDTCLTYQLLIANNIDLKRVVGYVIPKQE